MTRNQAVHPIFAQMLAGVRIASPSERTTVVAPWGFDMEVSFEYEEGEPPTISNGEFDHPGAPSTVALLSVKVGGVDVMEMLDLDQQLRIEDRILEQVDGY